jgi:hypothetical protein
MTKTTTGAATVGKGWILLFSTSAHPSRAARLHDVACPMVHTASRRGTFRRVERIAGDLLAETVDELNERGFPVVACKCCR